MTFAVPTTTVRTIPIVAGSTQAGIPVTRVTDGPTLDSIVCIDSTGAVAAGLSGSLADDGGLAAATGATATVNVASTVAAATYYALLIDAAGNVDSALELTVSAPVVEDDVFTAPAAGDLPAQTPYTGS